MIKKIRKFYANTSTTISEKILDVLMLILCLIFVCPMFSFINQYIFIALCSCTLFLLIKYHLKVVVEICKSKAFRLSFLFAFILIIYYFINDSLINKHILLLPFIILLSNYYLRPEKRTSCIFIGIIISIYLCLICLVTLYQMQSNPELTRILARGHIEDIKDFITPFTATYSTVYSIMLIGITLIQILFENINKLIKTIIILIEITIIYFLFKAAYTISLLLFFLGAIIIIFYNLIIKIPIKTRKKAYLYLFFSTILLIFLFIITRDYIADSIVSMTSFTSNYMQQRRIIEISELVRNLGIEENGGMLNRFSLYLMSVQTFIQNPIFGVGYHNKFLKTENISNPIIGGHSTIADFLGCYGIFSTIYIAIIPTFYYEYNKVANFSSKRKFAFFAILIIFMLLSLINTTVNISFYFVMLIFIPIILLLKHGG